MGAALPVGLCEKAMGAGLLLLSALCRSASAAGPFVGPGPVPSSGCGHQLPFPAGTPLDMNVPVPDPMLPYNKFREYYLYLPSGPRRKGRLWA